MYPGGENFTCRGYKVLAMLLMRAGAALPDGLRDAFLAEFERSRRFLASDYEAMSTPGRLFMQQRMCEEIKRYDVRGGRTFRLQLELPHVVVNSGGSQYRKLGPNTESFSEWERMCTRSFLPTAEHSAVRAMPKAWEMDGSVDMTLAEDEQHYLPLLFDSKRKLVVALALNPRTGVDSMLGLLSVDLLEHVCEFARCTLNVQSITDGGIKMKATVEMLIEHRDAFGQGLLRHPDEDATTSDAMMLKHEAGAAFSRHDYKTAANLYAQALGAIGPKMSEEDLSLKVILHSNLAEACLRMCKWSSAADHAQEALKLNPTHDKSMRRLATAKQMQMQATRSTGTNQGDDDNTDADPGDEQGTRSTGVTQMMDQVKDMNDQMQELWRDQVHNRSDLNAADLEAAATLLESQVREAAPVTARIVGVQSRPELNGQPVSVLQFVADSGRYCVRIADDSGSKQIEVRLKPKNLVLDIGTAVIVTGLVTPELNGRHGTVKAFEDSDGRYSVEVEGEAHADGGCLTSLDPENLRAVLPDAMVEIAAEVLTARLLRTEQLAIQHNLSAEDRAVLASNVVQAQSRQMSQQILAGDFQCPNCGTAHTSVVADVAQKWALEGCPQCLLSKDCPTA
jgi:tetratricopeptide (TPR) repeat protein